MVQSIEYYDLEHSSEKKPVQGVDELMHRIMSYWQKLNQKVSGFVSVRIENLQNMVDNTYFLLLLMVKQANIVVCGSACVGKSTLVNSLCGKEVPKTSSSLCSATDEMKKYVLNQTYQSVNEAASSTEYSITIWDTSGIES
ncbi:unnamed protein product [Rotaria sp. Silwood1]|nr:unnamed protein product [Rotaria sp. Silwood1]